jgi:hypothetical protein
MRSDYSIEPTAASPVVASFTSQQESESLIEPPSTALFEQPVGDIDRFAVARKLGFLFMLLIMVFVIMFLISLIKGWKIIISAEELLLTSPPDNSFNRSGISLSFIRRT